ncbi:MULTISPECIES: Ohr family peroxiredoxin [Amylolactobacillus]|nr:MULTISPECIES: Ohr family peroxiredoxin [Amylolactobacillus]GED80118.1 osmotically inducible protein OsmC [Amylolactobacillus amylophilus]
MTSYDAMKKISVKTAINEGGREGVSYTPNKSFEVKTSMTETPDTVTPELLFAAGFSACFNGAMSFPLEADGKGDLPRKLRAEVSLYNGVGTDFKLRVTLIGHIEGLSKDETLSYMKKGEQICPYSKATAGNIEVVLEAE